MLCHISVVICDVEFDDEFDPDRKAILLCGGDKRGKDQKRFYRNLIKVADRRFKLLLDRLEK